MRNFTATLAMALILFNVQTAHSSNFIKKEDMNMTKFLIQNNIKEGFSYLMREGGYEIKNFGKVVSVYSNSRAPDFNMIFSFPTEAISASDLKSALTYSRGKTKPFLLVHELQDGGELPQLMEQFYFKKVGVATRMAIMHTGISFAGIDKSNIKQVVNEKMLNEWCEILEEAWPLPKGSVKAYFAPIASLLKPDFQLKLFLSYATVEGKLQPIGTAFLYLPQDKQLLAGHCAWSVKAAYRNKGIMTNLVKNLILIAKEQGYSASVAQCFDTSKRLAERIGFASYGELEIYTNAAAKQEEAYLYL